MIDIVNLLAAGAAAASVAGTLLAVSTSRAEKNHKAREIEHKLGQAQQTNLIRDAVDGLATKVGERFDKNDELSAAASRRIDRLEDEQFGPNHGGARQAINELTADVRGLTTSLAKMSERVVRVETILSTPTLAGTTNIVTT